MMARMIDCLIIGAGQAGLAMSHCLTSKGIEHVVIERGRIGERWRSERWPSLRLLTPGWMTRLPGGALATKEDGFLKTGDFVNRLEGYASVNGLPVLGETEVLAVEQMDERFRVITSSGTWITRALVVATGACDRPRIPSWSFDLDRRIHRVTPSQYKGMDQLPDGGVLVVGSSATGVQLAQDAAAAGRRTILAAGRHVRTPRRYRGMDLFEWLDLVGFLREERKNGRSNRELMAQPSMQLVGSNSNSDINLSTLAAQGVTITGPEQIDLAAEGISTVIWATGYRRSYPWLHLDAFDEHGEIDQQDGIAKIPGLYTLGLPFMRHRSSSFIDGVGRDAEAMSQTISAQLGVQRLRAA